MSRIDAVISEIKDNKISDAVETGTEATLEVKYCLEDMKGSLRQIHASLLESINVQKEGFKEAARNSALARQDQLERDRESSRGDVSGGGGAGGGGGRDTQIKGGLGFLAAVAGSLAGLAVGFVEGIASSIRSAIKILKIDKLFEPIGKFIDNTFGKNSKVFQILDDVVTRAYVNIDDYIIKPLKNFGQRVKTFFKPVTEGIAKVRKLLEPIGKVFTKIGSLFGGLSSSVGKVGGIFDNFAGVFGKFFKAARAFGSVIGKLFIPIGIIMSIVDTIKGAIDGFTSQEGSFVDKLIAGLFGGLKGLINGLIMMPLDLLKDGVSWIAEKLGFSEFSGMLDSFSFQELFSGMIDGLKDMVLGIKDWFVENLSPSAIVDKLGSIGDSISQFIKELLRSILPDPTAPLMSAAGIASRAIPASIYEFAGIDKKTGKEIPRDAAAEEAEKEAPAEPAPPPAPPVEEKKETDRERQKREMAEFKARAKASGGVGYREATGADGTTVATTMKATELGQASLDAAAAVEGAAAEPTPAPAEPAPPPPPAPAPAEPPATATKASKANLDTMYKKLDEAQAIADERAALQEQIRALDAKVYDRATYEGLTKEEKIAKRNTLMAELSELSAKNKELRNKESAAFAEVEAAEDSMTFGGGDDFYAGTDDDLEDTSGMVLKSSTGGTTVTGGEETTTAVSAAQLEKDKKAVSAEQARFKAEQEAFKQMEQEGLVGADEFIMDDDPRYAELQKRTEAIMSGKTLQPAGRSASLTGQLQDATAQNKAATSVASAGTSIVAPTNNNVSNASITNQTTMPMPPSTDTSDRYASQFGAR